MSNQVPEGWSFQSIGDYVEKMVGGAPLKPSDFSASGVRVIPKKAVQFGGRIKFDKKTFCTNEFAKSNKRNVVDNQFLITTLRDLVPSGPTIGVIGVLSDTGSFILAQGVYGLKTKGVEDGYLAQVSNTSWYRNEMRKVFVGSTQVHIRNQEFLDVKILFPPLPEQLRIAAILTSVDEVIEKTQAQIDKLKDLKTAMMQDLLTKGIGTKQGNSYIPHTEFKDSSVGRIPKSWEVSSLGELASFVTSGSRGWAQYYSEAGPMFIRIGNLTREHINFRFKDVICVTPPNSAEGKRTLVQTGDVLISITADLGVIAVVNDDLGEAYVNQHVSLVRLNEPEISRWVGHFLSHEDSQKQFTANNDSGAKAGLNLTAIRNTKVAIPPADEMNQIVKAFDSLDCSIAIKRKKLSKMQDTKKALMQDLLTGKVRVKVD